MNRLGERRFLAVALLACAFGAVLGIAVGRLGFSARAAATSGACTTAIALMIALIASQLYGRWFPELEFFPESERRAALHAAPPYGILAAYVVAFVSLSWFAIPILKWLQAYGGTKALVLGLATVWTMPVLLAVWCVREPIRRGLRRQLAKRGRPICVRCGYDTRGQIEPRCPECGRPLSDHADGSDSSTLV